MSEGVKKNERNDTKKQPYNNHSQLEAQRKNSAAQKLVKPFRKLFTLKSQCNQRVHFLPEIFMEETEKDTAEIKNRTAFRFRRKKENIFTIQKIVNIFLFVQRLHR